MIRSATALTTESILSRRSSSKSSRCFTRSRSALSLPEDSDFNSFANALPLSLCEIARLPYYSKLRDDNSTTPAQSNLCSCIKLVEANPGECQSITGAGQGAVNGRALFQDFLSLAFPANVKQVPNPAISLNHNL